MRPSTAPKSLIHLVVTLTAPALAAAALTGSGCGHLDAVHASGAQASETRQIDSFSAISNEALADVELTVGEATSVTVDCDSALIGYVRTTVERDQLRIDVAQDDGSPVSVTGSFRCRVTAFTPGLVASVNSGSGDTTLAGVLDSLAVIDSSGSGDTHVNDPIDVPDLQVTSSGSGNIAIVGGTSDSLAVDASGSGDCDIQGLAATDVAVVSSGSGDVHVTALERIRIDLGGSGDVAVSGNPPDREETVTGSGRVKYL